MHDKQMFYDERLFHKYIWWKTLEAANFLKYIIIYKLDGACFVHEISSCCKRGIFKTLVGRGEGVTETTWLRPLNTGRILFH